MVRSVGRENFFLLSHVTLSTMSKLENFCHRLVELKKKQQQQEQAESLLEDVNQTGDDVGERDSTNLGHESSKTTSTDNTNSDTSDDAPSAKPSSENFIDLKALSEILEGNPDARNDPGVISILNRMRQQFVRPNPPSPTTQAKIRQKMAKVLDNDFTLSKIASKIKSHEINRIMVLTGAGVSVSAGIPDFRTPGTGLYDNLQKYNLPEPTAVFELDFYRDNPDPFIQLSSELWPQVGHFKPTPTHAFLKLLDDKELLMRNYTQNIDGLEVIAGVDAESVVECHGHYRSARCADCNKKADIEVVKEKILVEKKVPICKRCGGNVKPDIVFFGEDLPQRFHNLIRGDVKKADMLIVIGTSLLVSPVSQIPDMVGDFVPRLLINRELVGDFEVESEQVRGASLSNRWREL